MTFEESLVWHASPTLANMKMASLYSYRFNSIDECIETIRHFNLLMNIKGIYIELLKNIDDFYLIYVYRKSHLKAAFGDANIQLFLENYGYSLENDLQGYMLKLKSRLNTENDFPHEIGVFLGYPLEDVKSFIDTKGEQCVLCGDWKVYHDEETARCLFCKYKRCRETYVRVYREGRRFKDMLVSA